MKFWNDDVPTVRMIDDEDSTFFITSVDPMMKSPWMEIKLTSAVEGLIGMEIVTSWVFKNMRISAGSEPTSMEEGGITETVDQINTFMGKFTDPEIKTKTYITFSRAVTAQYILLQLESEIPNFLGKF